MHADDTQTRMDGHVCVLTRVQGGLGYPRAQVLGTREGLDGENGLEVSQGRKPAMGSLRQGRYSDLKPKASYR